MTAPEGQAPPRSPARRPPAGGARCCPARKPPRPGDGAPPAGRSRRSPGTCTAAPRPSKPTSKAYLTGKRQPGPRASWRPDTFGPFADYLLRRFTDDPHLDTRALFAEVTGLGYPDSYPTFCRALHRSQQRQRGCQACQAPPPASDIPSAPTSPPRKPGPLPLPVPLVAGEVLASYLGRLAAANHVTIADVLSVLPPWFHTKIRNHDDRSHTTYWPRRPTRPCTRSPPSPAGHPLPWPAHSPPSLAATSPTPSGPPPPAAGAWPPAESRGRSPCPPATRSAPAMGAGSPPPTYRSSTSPSALRSSSRSTAPAASCNAARLSS